MKFGQLVKSILLLSVLLGCSCAHYACDPGYVGPKTRSAEMLDYYSYPEQTVEAEIETVREKKRYVIECVEFPSALNVFDTSNIKFDFYVQRQEGRVPTIIIWPIPDEVDFCARGFARHFAANGFNVA
ncbi:MAG: hypothetical protein ACYTEK_19160, partial [Planctomycetota bacterium]